MIAFRGYSSYYRQVQGSAEDEYEKHVIRNNYFFVYLDW